MVVGLCQSVWSSPFSCRWFGFAGWHWQPIMVHRVCQRTPPLAVRYDELWRSEWLSDIRVDTVLQMQHVVDRVELAELGGCVIMGLTCELSWFVVTNPHVRVRRSSAANWGGMVMQEGRGVLASGVLAAGYCCHCRVGWEGMKGPGLFMWCTCCGEGIVLVIWGAGAWEETFRMSDLIWCSPEEWQVTETALSGTWGVSSAGVCWTLLWFGVLGVELVFNSVAGFSGGVSCPSEVRVFTVLWEWGDSAVFCGWFVQLVTAVSSDS